jgi:hypothetical protein
MDFRRFIGKNFMKLIYLIIILSIIGSYAINHKLYGNSNSTTSQYETLRYYLSTYQKIRKSRKLADYIYGRILYWQIKKEK